MAGSSQQATQYVLTPLPDSPSSKNLFEHHTKMDVGDDCLNETLTPVSTSRFSRKGLEEDPPLAICEQNSTKKACVATQSLPKEPLQVLTTPPSKNLMLRPTARSVRL
ncbi:hypothetical protein QE152_g40345 [Popillia japonica]|uniref:Uncharacterized protein n=1 Tax=Popillia japonica TaxID=7064 RepID=A0AAW1HRF1_POPJA